MSQPPTGRRPGPSLRLSIVVIVVGLAAGIPSLIGFVRPIAHTFTAPIHLAGTQFTQQLETGHYTVFDREDIPDVRRIGPLPRALQPSEVLVSTPTGTSVPTTFATSNETLDRNGARYVARVRFETTESGVYIFHVSGGHEVIVTRSFGDTFRSAVKWLPTMLLGFMAAIGGVVMLIVGIVRRSKANQPQPSFAGSPGGVPPVPASAPPAGWYPDPHQPNRWRYWDGTGWTDHTG